MTRYWQVRTHAIGWRRLQDEALRRCLDHHESVGKAFVATVAWIALVVVFMLLGLALTHKI